MEKKYKKPIKFEHFQSDIENLMYQLDLTTKKIDELIKQKSQLCKLKNDFQRKINIHIEEGDWV